MLYGACVPAEDSRSVHGHGPVVPGVCTHNTHHTLCIYVCVTWLRPRRRRRLSTV